ncbi:MAG: PAS domain S-box protein [Spirochaetota bacterium]|nr:PAS domain S-box protein [Spirochaetota bacterium]
MTFIFKYKLILFANVFSILLANPVSALEPVRVNNSTTQYPLGHHLEILEDKNKQWTILDVTSDKLSKQFVKSKIKVPNFGFTNSAYWARFTVKNTLAKELKWYLEINYSTIEQINLYIPKKNNSYIHKKAGNIVPYTEREVKHRNVVFSLSQAPDEEKTYYIRFESKANLILPLTIWAPSSFYENSIYEYIVFGLFYGILFVMMLYNFFLYITIKDISYLYYVIFIFTLIKFYLVYDGISFQLLPFDLGFWFNHKFHLTLFISIVSGLLFIRSFLNINKSDFKLNITLLFAIFLGVLGILVSIFLTNHIIISISNFYGLIVVCVIIVAALLRLKKGYRPALYILIAWSAFVLGCIALVLTVLDILPFSLYTHHAMKFGSAVEVILLSLALGDRINIIKYEKEIAQNEAFNNLKETYRLKDEFAKTLEEKIEARTEELKESEERYRLLIEFSPDGIAVHAGGTLLFVNSYGKKLMGVTHDDEYLGKSIAQFVHPDSLEKVKYRLSQAVNEPGKLLPPEEEKYLRLNGEVLDVEVSTTSFIYNGEQAFLTIFRDIRRRKQVERLREDTERIIKHDLKGPLNSVLGFSELLLDGSLPRNLQEYAAYIFDSGKQMLKMIDNSLDLFKMEEGSYELKPEDMDLIQMFDELNKEFIPLQEMKSVILICEINGELVGWGETYPIVGEKAHLRNMFGNLIKNAIEASPENKKITVSISDKNDFDEITIHNYGVIPESMRDRFFDRYSTSGKKGGTGIGTYSALLTAKSHGGNITFSSSDTEGTRLFVHLPKNIKSS